MIDRDGQVDYEDYSDIELKEAVSAIDGDKYPENLSNLFAELKQRGLEYEYIEPDLREEAIIEQHEYSELARSPDKARVTGLVILVTGIVWFLFRFDEGVFRTRRGQLISFAEDPVWFSIFMTIHGALVLFGLLCLIFGSRIFRELAVAEKGRSIFKKGK